MKRILVLVTVVALMVVMTAMSVAPAFAAGWGENGCRNDDILFVATVQTVSKDRNQDGFVCEHFGSATLLYDNHLFSRS